jgi:hypothetical protein
MDEPRHPYAAAQKTVGWVLSAVGVASFGVLLLGVRKLALLERALDVGDLAVLGVFAAFGSFCLAMGWRMLRDQPDPDASALAAPAPGGPPASKRVTVSRGCAATGVFLLILSVLVPEQGYPVVLLFVGLALLAVSHALTPCVERMEQLRRARDSMRQL